MFYLPLKKESTKPGILIAEYEKLVCQLINETKRINSKLTASINREIYKDYYEQFVEVDKTTYRFNQTFSFDK